MGDLTSSRVKASGTVSRPHPVMTEYYENEEARQRWVDRIFDATAAHYDRINSLMSLGSGRWYRANALRRHGLLSGMKLLDVGTGTGAIACLAQERVGPEGEVIAIDPSSEMLIRARAAGVVNAVPGRGDELPLSDDRFDMLTMGYALRHVGDLNSTFNEYHRVLAPGGKVLLLEVTPPHSRFGFFVLRLYLRGVVPLISRVFFCSRDVQTLMRYYWDTIENCVPPETILEALRNAGFEQVERHVVLGIFSEYSGMKPNDRY